jgi:hypothetical protein
MVLEYYRLSLGRGLPPLEQVVVGKGLSNGCFRDAMPWRCLWLKLFPRSAWFLGSAVGASVGAAGGRDGLTLEARSMLWTSWTSSIKGSFDCSAWFCSSCMDFPVGFDNSASPVRPLLVVARPVSEYFPEYRVE